MASLPTRYIRAGLSRLMHYCSAQGIAPRGGRPGGVRPLRRGDPAGQLHPQPAGGAPDRGAAVEPGRRHASPAGRRPRIAQPRYAKPYVLPLDSLPGLVPGRGRGLAAIGSPGDGPLEEGPLRPLRPRSLEQRRFYLRQAASALVAWRPRSGQHRRPRRSGHGRGDAGDPALLPGAQRQPADLADPRPRHPSQGDRPAPCRCRRRPCWSSSGAWCAGSPRRRPAWRSRTGWRSSSSRIPSCCARLIRLPDRDLRHPAAAGQPLPPRTALRFQWALAVQILLVAPDPAGQSGRARARPASAADRHRQAAALPPRDPRRGGQERPADRAAAAGRGQCHARALPHPGAAGAGRARHRWLFPGETAGRKALVTLGGQISRFLERELGAAADPAPVPPSGRLHLSARSIRTASRWSAPCWATARSTTTLRHYAGLEGAAAARHYDATLRAGGRAWPGPAAARDRARRPGAVEPERRHDAQVRAGDAGRLCLPLAAWPAGDRACWAAATAGRSAARRRPGGASQARQPAQASPTAMAAGWPGWPSRPARPGRRPRGPGHPRAVAAYIAELRQVNAPRTVLGRLADLATVLGWFAPEQRLGLADARSWPGCGPGSGQCATSAPGCAAPTSCWRSASELMDAPRPASAPALPCASAPGSIATG